MGPTTMHHDEETIQDGGGRSLHFGKLRNCFCTSGDKPSSIHGRTRRPFTYQMSHVHCIEFSFTTFLQHTTNLPPGCLVHTFLVLSQRVQRFDERSRRWRIQYNNNNDDDDVDDG